MSYQENTDPTQEMSQVRLLLYYPQEPSNEEKEFILRGLKRWSNEHQGSEPVEEYAKQESWEAIFLIWLPSAIASGIIGWAISKILDDSYHLIGGKNKPLLQSSQEHWVSQEGESVREETKSMIEVKLPSEIDEVEKYSGLGHLADFLQPGPQPRVATFVKLGEAGAPAQAVSIHGVSNNILALTGTNEEIMKWTQEITFRPPGDASP